MILDFHCHISTPSSRMPATDGEYYRALGTPNTASHLLGELTHEAMSTVAERWRTPRALRAYRNVGPLIYTEMLRRMMATDGASLLAEMADNKIDKAVVVAMDPIIPTDEVLQTCRLLHGVLLPFGSVDPWTDDYQDRFECLLQSPIVGIKFHSDLQNLPFDSQRLRNLLTILSNSHATKLPVYLHTGNFPIYRPPGVPWEKALPLLLDDFPQISFVCGHSGWDSPRAALRAALSHPNLFLETSWQPPALIRRLCDKLGPERLLFGSDYPLYSQRRALRNVRAALTDEEVGFVTYGNAAKLLRL